MELKPGSREEEGSIRILLIVPYGIETLSEISDKLLMFLLIVPYGIETYAGDTTLMEHINLLIVPYGIETTMLTIKTSLRLSFNRTLWN